MICLPVVFRGNHGLWTKCGRSETRELVRPLIESDGLRRARAMGPLVPNVTLRADSSIAFRTRL
jgi:hypothetical protein